MFSQTNTSKRLRAPSRHRQSGLSLIEVLIAVGLSLLLSAVIVDQMRVKSESDQTYAVGQSMREVGSAFDTYIALRYNKLVLLTNVGNSSVCTGHLITNPLDPSAAGTAADPGPRCCDPASGICSVNSDTLRRNGLLPNSFSGYNAYGAQYVYEIRVQGTSPNYIVDGIVYTSTPYVTGGATPRYDLLGAAMQTAGADSGMTRTSATNIEGLNGAWQESGFSDVNQLGLLAMRAGYGTSGYAAYLRLDGASAMTGDLDMGGNGIDNAGQINAKGVTLPGKSTSTGLAMGNVIISTTADGNSAVIYTPGTVYTSNLSGGYAPIQTGSANINGDATVTGTVTASSLISTGGVTAQGDSFHVQGAHGFVNDTYNGGWYMQDSTWLRSYNDKNVYTGGEVRANTMTALTKLNVGDNVHTVAPGSACSYALGIGLAQSNANNEILQCRNSVWTPISGASVQVVNGATTSPGGSAAATCPIGTTVTGGGWRLATYSPGSGANTQAAPIANEPSGNGWYIQAGTITGNSTFQAYALCASS